MYIRSCTSFPIQLCFYSVFVPKEPGKCRKSDNYFRKGVYRNSIRDNWWKDKPIIMTCTYNIAMTKYHEISQDYDSFTTKKDINSGDV